MTNTTKTLSKTEYDDLRIKTEAMKKYHVLAKKAFNGGRYYAAVDALRAAADLREQIAWTEETMIDAATEELIRRLLDDIEEYRAIAKAAINDERYDEGEGALKAIRQLRERIIMIKEKGRSG